MSAVAKFENLKDRIIEIRDQKVLLDVDVADIYGVETKRINEAVKINPDKFPSGYIIELDKAEWGGLKSKISTSKKAEKLNCQEPSLKKACICWQPFSKVHRSFRLPWQSSKLLQK